MMALLLPPSSWPIAVPLPKESSFFCSQLFSEAFFFLWPHLDKVTPHPETGTFSLPRGTRKEFLTKIPCSVLSAGFAAAHIHHALPVSLPHP